jgi:hypothetical protein
MCIGVLLAEGRLSFIERLESSEAVVHEVGPIARSERFGP